MADAATTPAPPSGPAVLRTPDERFDALAGYPFEPRYVEVSAESMPPLRMHYVDHGPRDAPVVLLLHGQPTWSYMWRRTVQRLGAGGLRAIAPDNIGFGRSDKPADPTDYTFERHVQWTTSFVDALDLRAVTLVVHDWGGPLGLSALARVPERFARVVATNTVLHSADPELRGVLRWANHGFGRGRVVHEEALVDYVLFCQRAPELLPSMLLYSADGALAPEVLAAYDAPFPHPGLRAGLRQMTSLIPLTRSDPGAAVGRATMRALRSWRRPFLTAYSDADPATRGWDEVFRRTVPGAAGLEHPIIKGAGHFVPEERGDELARIVADLVAGTPGAGEDEVTRATPTDGQG